MYGLKKEKEIKMIKKTSKLSRKNRTTIARESLHKEFVAPNFFLQRPLQVRRFQLVFVMIKPTQTSSSENRH